MKPHILIFSIAYTPNLAGAELAVSNITDRLLLYEFDLITCRFDKNLPSYEKIGNVNVYRVGFGNRLGRYLYPVFAYRLARKLHQKEPYNLVWAIMASYASAAALMFLRRFPKVKFLLTLQEGDSLEHIHRRVRGFKKQWQKIFKRADYIQAISSYLADWAKKEGTTGKIQVVPNGVDIEKFNSKNLDISATSDNPKTIITTSRLVKKNGVDILIKALAIVVKDSGEQVKLQIIGAGPEENALKELAKQKGVENQVEFLGSIDYLQLPNFLSKAHIFVRPSRSEGLGSSFLEAMAVGLPVIGTSVGGIPDFLKDNETGLFAKTDDPTDVAKKIRILLSDSELRKSLSEQGQKLVQEKFSWDKIALEMGNIFDSVIAS